MIALRHQEASFTKLVFCDADADNVAALRGRSSQESTRVVVKLGNCNETIEDLTQEIPAYGLNLALVDPFRLDDLRFETLSRLASFTRMDLIIFFPIWEIRRFALTHQQKYAPLLTRALGTADWGTVLRRPSDAPQLIRLFHKQLETQLGYTPNNTYSAPIRIGNRVALYHLVFASKSVRGDRIWESVTRRSPNGQGRIF